MTATVATRKQIPDWVYDCVTDTTPFRKFWITKGLGSGGTYGLALWHLILCGINSRSEGSWCVAPTYSQVVDPLIPTFRQVLTDFFGKKEGRHFEFVHSPLPMLRLLDSQQIIYFKSGNHPEFMVAANLSHASITEVGLLKSGLAVQKTTARLRCPKAVQRQLFGEGTPEGLNWWADYANFDPGENTELNARRIIVETDDNPYLPEGYVENNLLINYAHDPIKLESYRYGRFVGFSKGTAYWNYVDRPPMVIDRVPPDPFLPILFGWDFNKSPLAWVAGQRIWRNRGQIRYPVYRALHESTGTSKGLNEAVGEFAARFPLSQFRSHPIEIHGDASGWAGSHKTPTSDYKQILQHMGDAGYTNVTLLAREKNPLVRTRLERTATLMHYGMVEICSHLTRLRKGYSHTALKDGTWEIQKPQGDTWTHYADAWDYTLFRTSTDLDLEGTNLKTYGLNLR